MGHTAVRMEVDMACAHRMNGLSEEAMSCCCSATVKSLVLVHEGGGGVDDMPCIVVNAECVRGPLWGMEPGPFHKPCPQGMCQVLQMLMPQQCGSLNVRGSALADTVRGSIFIRLMSIESQTSTWLN